MPNEIWAALIGAGVGVVSALLAWVASRQALRAQQVSQREALNAQEVAQERALQAQEKTEIARVAEATKTLEVQFERRMTELRQEQQHELRRVLHESRSGHEREVLTMRLNSYQSLMALLKPLSLDGRAAPTHEEAAQIAYQLTDWYADSGGLLLSKESRDLLLALRASLLGEPRDDERLKNEYPPRRDASKLRTQLTQDVLSRGLPFQDLEAKRRVPHEDRQV